MKLHDWQIWIRTKGTLLGGWQWAPLGDAPPITTGRALWLDLKLVRVSKQPSQRNAWHLRVSLAHGRLAKSSEHALLCERDPKLATLLDADLVRLVRAAALAP